MRYSLLVIFNHFLHILELLCIPLAILPYVVAEPAVNGADRDFPVKEVQRNVLLHRVKRTIGPDSNGFTAEEEEEIVKAHNDLRSSVKASNMMKMEWDTGLRDLAQEYADRCVYEHSSQDHRGNKAGFTYIGENLYAGNAVFKPADVVQLWYDEVKDYNYDSGCASGRVCGHYTQVIWATTKAVGCGYKFCSPLNNSRISPGYIVVCEYGEGGNVVGEKPYMTGEVCSECPEEMKFCTGNLCSMTSSPSPSVKDNKKAMTSSPSPSVKDNKKGLILSMAFILYTVLLSL